MDDARVAPELRERLCLLAGGARPALALGLGGIDAALGGGLAQGSLHEVAGEAGAATGFCAFLLARIGGPVLWCHAEGRAPYPHGLGAFGLDPGRMLWLALRRPADRLKAMEEGLRCPGLAAVLGEVDAVDGTASRRLQLAAEAGGVTALLLRQRHGAATTAVTRWRVTAAPGGGRWQVALLHCRGGRAGSWLMEWSDETGGCAVVAALRDGSAAPAA